MQCPVCSVALTMSDRQGIEIDYCPQCRGVWLDRGELDKIIERSRGGFASAEDRPVQRPEQRPEQRPDRFSGYSGDRPVHRDHDHEYPKRKRKESWFEDLFD